MRTLLKLFIPADQYEAIVGDLLEESATWRQSWKAVGHIVLGHLKDAPIMTVATVLGAMVALYYKRTPTEWMARIVLANYHPYHYVNAHTFWLILDVLVISFVTPMVIGWITAAMSKGREMAVALTLSFLSVSGFVLAVVGFYRWLGSGAPDHGIPVDAHFVITNVRSFPIAAMREALAILLGAILCKWTRDRYCAPPLPQ